MNSSNINPKSCTYGCGLQIYWNTESNGYWEVFTKKKYICSNRVTNNNKKSATFPSTTTKPSYYNNNNKKLWPSTNNLTPKPKMDNSFELLTGSPDTIRKQYISF